MMLQENISLVPYHTFHCQVQARYLIRCDSVEDFRNAFRDTRFQDLPKLILGGGSNVLFRNDYRGVVLLNGIKGISVEREDDEHVWLRAAGGEIWHEVVMFAVEHGWGGIENLSLIPGSAGAAPMQNIGAYGAELQDVFESLEALHIESGEIKTFDRTSCAFGYRESIFKHAAKDQYVITSILLRLSKHPVVHIAYGNLVEELEKAGISHPAIRDVSEAVCRIRRSKLPDPSEIGNAGSFFKNPVIDAGLANQLKTLHPDMPVYPQENGQVKLAAGWLIEQAGWKGHREGEVGVHKRQALVLVNHGHGSGSDILRLSEMMMHDVHRKFGVTLEREVNLIP
ncbi:MAG: UDP-N-acetylmuramate dehydrogenase [Flavobacteriales bacterium]|nr:UDP-N-acetylmuramate dehydrogenase [Flavobacteriales bacterium]